MSQLQKKIERIQRPEGPRLGFGPVSRDKARALLLGVVATGAAEARTALGAGADLVLVRGQAESVAAVLKEIAAEGACLGALVDALDETGAAKLKEAGCDFVVAPANSTEAAAVDTGATGHVVHATLTEPEPFLRGLAPLGLDGLYVGELSASLSLAGQVDLVRTASLASTPLLVAVGPAATAAQLRVLRDSGVGAVLVPAGVDTAALDSALRAVPPPRAAHRGGRELALVPSLGGSGHDEHDHEDDDD